MTRALVVGGACILVSSMSACGTKVSFTPTNIPPHPMTARPIQSVQVFTTAVPNQPYVEVGVIEARQASAYSSGGQTKILNAMRTQAAQYGCDGLVINGTANSVEGSGSTSNGSGSSSVRTLKGFRGTCIVFTGPPAQAGPASAPPPVAVAAAARCFPGATQACTGPGGCHGGQACNTDGTAFTACDCGPAAAASSAPTTNDPAAAGDAPSPVTTHAARH